MQARLEISTQLKLESCLDFHRQRFPNINISPELVMIITWILQDKPDFLIDNIVYSANACINKIQGYIKLANQKYPDFLLDIETLYLFDCINENFKSSEVEYGFHIARLVHQYINAYKESESDVLINDEIRHLFCYIAHTQPKLSPTQAIIQLGLIRRKIAIYLDAANVTSRYDSLNILKIKYYLWVAQEFPQLDTNKVLSWVHDMYSSNLYRRTTRLFPPNYPFSSITWDTHMDGTAILAICSKTCVASTLLDLMLTIPGSRKSYMDKGIIIEFNLQCTDTLESITKKVDRFFNLLENTLLQKDNDAHIIHDCKTVFFHEVRLFFLDYNNKFPGLIYLQLHPPINIPIKNTSIMGMLMRIAIDTMDYAGLQKLLADGASPNQRQFGLSMLECVVGKIRNYEVFMLAGVPTQAHCNMLLESHEVNTTFLDRNSYKVIIAKHAGNYNLYWCTSDKIIINAPILSAVDIEFLNSISGKYFEHEYGNIRTTAEIKDTYKLTEIILPYMKDSLEIQRKHKAAMVLKFAELLMEYGADPGIRHDPNHPGSQTVVEALIDDSRHIPDVDELNKALLCDLIKLLLFADLKRSHLTIADSHTNHFLGSLILKYLNRDETMIITKLQSATLEQRFAEYFLHFTNNQNKHVYLKTVSRTHLSDKEKNEMIALCKKRFPWRGKVLEHEFIDYIAKKIKPSKEISVVDLLCDVNNTIIAFNIADIVLPKSAGKPILHFIQLSASEAMIQKEFKELMSQISLQRIVFLKDTFKCEVLTSYTAASAVSYLQTAKLPRVFPKHNCLRSNDRIALFYEFFPNRKPIEDFGAYYFESILHYHFDEIKSDFADAAQLNCRGYNSRIEKPGCSTLVAFYSTPENLENIARKVETKMANGLTFFSIADKAKALEAVAYQIDKTARL